MNGSTRTQYSDELPLAAEMDPEESGDGHAEETDEEMRLSLDDFLLPGLLYLLTWWSTNGKFGPAYAVSLMTILTFHEAGHFFQTRIYRIPASLPFFIPLPFKFFSLGTMGAVMGLEAHRGDRKALFDVAISGPIAGLVPAILFSIVGLYHSTVFVVEPGPVPGRIALGEPLVFQFLVYCIHGSLPSHLDIQLSPMAFAGWAGIFITALNLIPIGQLDGGHILYALIGERAHFVARTLLFVGCFAMILTGSWGWFLLLALLFYLGPEHPPTANDSVRIGPVRTLLGWLALGFVVVGFTPVPFQF